MHRGLSLNEAVLLARRQPHIDSIAHLLQIIPLKLLRKDKALDLLIPFLDLVDAAMRVVVLGEYRRLLGAPAVLGVAHGLDGVEPRQDVILVLGGLERSVAVVAGRRVALVA